jgi:hypothetical protein
MANAAGELNKQVTISRLERKIVIPTQTTDFVIAWLQHACLPDSVYPRNIINSLYFDTPELDSYYECLNGDFYKNKVRIRWYDHPAAGRDITAYLEVKSKRGFYSSKQRTQIKIPAQVISRDGINSSFLRQELDRSLPGLGYCPVKPMLPLIIVTYRRYRFRDRYSGMSLSCDLGITSQAVSGRINAHLEKRELKVAVLEIKGDSMEVPGALKGLDNLGLRWSGFSKYARCLESHLEKPDYTGET